MNFELIYNEWGFIAIPDEQPADPSPRGVVTWARALMDEASAQAEDYLIDHGMPPLEMAVIDTRAKCLLGWWHPDAGGVGPEYPGARLVAYVNVALPPTEPDLPPPPPDPVPIPAPEIGE